LDGAKGDRLSELLNSKAEKKTFKEMGLGTGFSLGREQFGGRISFHLPQGGST
jgi:hypothetical protein